MRTLAMACIAFAILAVAAWPYIASAALLFDLSGAQSSLRSLLPVRVAPVRTEDVALTTRHGAIGARLYRASGRPSRAIVVVPGVHAGGVDEPRLDALSRRLAGAGAIVLSVPLPELRAYRITPTSTDVIEDAVIWFAGREPRSWSRVGLIGVSFSGGLAIVAAGRPRLQDRLTAVVSLGGHGDLPRALRYLCTGQLPDGRMRAPHDYSLAVLLLSAVPRLVPAPQAEPLERALTAFLDASSVVAADPAAADRLVRESREITDGIAEPARAIMERVYARDVGEIGRRLLPLVDDLGGHPALSPERSPPPSVPVFLIQGTDDNVIPSSELSHLSDYLARHGTPVQSLLTPLVTHADVHAGATWVDRWRLVNIWTDVWGALGK